jgi:hypothetical protein
MSGIAKGPLKIHSMGSMTSSWQMRIGWSPRADGERKLVEDARPTLGQTVGEH